MPRNVSKDNNSSLIAVTDNDFVAPPGEVIVPFDIGMVDGKKPFKISHDGKVFTCRVTGSYRVELISPLSFDGKVVFFSEAFTKKIESIYTVPIFSGNIVTILPIDRHDKLMVKIIPDPDQGPVTIPAGTRLLITKAA